MIIKQQSLRKVLFDIFQIDSNDREITRLKIPDSFTLPLSKYIFDKGETLIIETESQADGIPVLVTREYESLYYDSMSVLLKIAKVSVDLNYG